MKVFKVYFKILNKNRKSVLIPIIVCLIIAFLFSAANKDGGNSFAYSDTKTAVAMINRDENTPYSEGLEQYLSKYATFLTMEDEDDIRDALFLGQLEYAVIIPKGFYQSCLEGKKETLSKMTAAQSFGSVNMDRRIQEFNNTWQAYHEMLPNLTGEELTKKTLEALDQHVTVTIMGNQDDFAKKDNLVLYFNHSEYATLGAIIAGMIIVINILNQPDLKRRLRCSPMEERTRNIQLFFANFIFATIIFLINIGIAFQLFGALLLTTFGLWLCVNLFIFTLTTMSMGLLVSELSRSREVQSAIVNILSLGMCFSSGAFVPQQYLGESVINVARFTPAYWFIKANESLREVTEFAFANMKEIYISFAIECGFAIAIVALSLVLAKHKTQYGN